MGDVPDHLRRYLPERPEPTPEERFNAYLSEQAATNALERPQYISNTRGRWAMRILGALAWVPPLAIGYGVGRWAGWW